MTDWPFALTAWSFPHERHGSCVEGCREYGRCHCGCGRRTGRPRATRPSKAERKGEPRVWVAGHNPRRMSGFWSRSGVPIERMVPLARWARDFYGSYRLASRASGIPHRTLNNIGVGDIQRVSRPTAEALSQFVLTHRRPADPLRTFGTDAPARLATERDAAEAKEIAYRERKLNQAYDLAEREREKDRRLGRAAAQDRERLSLKEIRRAS